MLNQDYKPDKPVVLVHLFKINNLFFSPPPPFGGGGGGGGKGDKVVNLDISYSFVHHHCFHIYTIDMHTLYIHMHTYTCRYSTACCRDTSLSKKCKDPNKQN